MLFPKEANQISECTTALLLRDIPLDQMQEWIAEDEKEVEVFWENAEKKGF